MAKNGGITTVTPNDTDALGESGSNDDTTSSGADAGASELGGNLPAGGSPTGGSDTTRRRGRPATSGSRRRKESTSTVNLVDVDNYNAGPSKTSAGRKSGLTSEKIANYLALGFNMFASFRGPHWNKNAAELATLAEPLATWIEQQDSATKKAMEKYALPGAILFGLAVTLQEPIRYEIEFANEAKTERAARKVSGQTRQGQGQTQFNQRPENGNANGVAGGHAVASSPLVDIPTAPD